MGGFIDYAGLLYSASQGLLGNFQIITGLQIHPELWRLRKCFTKKYRQFSGNWPFSFYYVRNAHCRYADRKCKSILRHTNPEYASAQPLDFLARRKNPRFPKRQPTVSCPEFPDRN